LHSVRFVGWIGVSPPLVSYAERPPGQGGRSGERGASHDMAKGRQGPCLATGREKSAQVSGPLPSEAPILAHMKTAIDDLPGVSVSRMRALGNITVGTKTTTVKFGDVEFVVAL